MCIIEYVGQINIIFCIISSYIFYIGAGNISIEKVCPGVTPRIENKKKKWNISSGVFNAPKIKLD